MNARHFQCLRNVVQYRLDFESLPLLRKDKLHKKGLSFLSRGPSSSNLTIRTVKKINIKVVYAVQEGIRLLNVRLIPRPLLNRVGNQLGYLQTAGGSRALKKGAIMQNKKEELKGLFGAALFGLVLGLIFMAGA